MMTSLMKLRSAFAHMLGAGHRARAQKQLERLDQATLNDLGMSRVELVSLIYGKAAGRCAAF